VTLRTRLAGSLALVALLVAAAVGLLSYHAADDRVYGEIDQNLRTISAAVVAGETQVLATVAESDSPRRPDGPPLVAQVVAPDGTVMGE